MLFDGPTVYLGKDCSYHYGHFLLETLPSLSYLLKNNDKALFTLSRHRCSVRKSNKFVKKNSLFKQFLKILNISEKRIFTLNQYDASFSIKAKDASFALHKGVLRKKNYLKIISKLKKNLKIKPQPKRKIFISRSLLGARQRVCVEHNSLIEDLFKKAGYEIIHPEKLSIKKQLKIYFNTEFLAGFTGSGMHNSMFLNKNSQVIVIDDKQSNQGRLVNDRECAKIADCKFNFIEYSSKNLKHTLREINKFFLENK